MMFYHAALFEDYSINAYGSLGRQGLYPDVGPVQPQEMICELNDR